MKLRDYQQECVDKMMNMDKNIKGIACIPTGGGKTILMSEIARNTTGRILIVVMNTELREQTIDKLKMVHGSSVDVGSVQGSLKEYDNKIIVATRQTLTSKSFNAFRLLDKGNFDLIMFDECHVAIEQQQLICLMLATENTKVIGFTATPYNLDMKYLYDEIIYKRELIDMINEGYLVKPVCMQVKSDTNLDDIKIRFGDFNQRQLGEKVNNEVRNKLILQSYVDMCQDRNKTLIFTTNVKHSQAIAECFVQNGILAKSIDGSCSKTERKQIFNDFETGKIKVLVNVDICTIGLDIPSIDCIIFARPTKSKGLYIQMLGRGLRLSPQTGKTDCLVIDIVDVTTKHNLINGKTVFDVDIEEKQNKKKKVTKEEILEAIEEEEYEEQKQQEYIEDIQLDINIAPSYEDTNILVAMSEKLNPFVKSAKKKVESLKKNYAKMKQLTKKIFNIFK